MSLALRTARLPGASRAATRARFASKRACRSVRNARALLVLSRCLAAPAAPAGRQQRQPAGCDEDSRQPRRAQLRRVGTQGGFVLQEKQLSSAKQRALGRPAMAGWHSGRACRTGVCRWRAKLPWGACPAEPPAMPGWNSGRACRTGVCRWRAKLPWGACPAEPPARGGRRGTAHRLHAGRGDSPSSPAPGWRRTYLPARRGRSGAGLQARTACHT
jgi:hypothetical protein